MPALADKPEKVTHVVHNAPWPLVRLSDIGKTVTGSTPPKAQKEYYGGDFPFVKPGELVNRIVHDSVDKLSEAGAEVADVAPEGSVLVSCIGNLGKTALAGRPLAFNQQINAVIPHDPETGKWIFYAVQSPDFLAQLTAVSSATTISIVNKSKFSALTIPWAPLPDQRRIVAEIEQQFTRLDAGVAALRRTQANLKRYRAAVLKAACEGRLVPTEAELARENARVLGSIPTGDFDSPSQSKGGRVHGSTPSVSTHFETGEALLARILTERRKNWQVRGKFKEAALPNTHGLPSLPSGWAWASIDQLCGHITSGSRDWSQFYGKGSGTFILAQNIRPMRFDMSERQSVAAPKGDAETERTRVQQNDILITIVGAKTGDICRVPQPIAEHFVCQSVALLRPVSESTSRFIELYLASPENGQAIWKRFIYGQGRPHLGFDELRITAVAFPPLAEQTRIITEVERRLSVVDELESVLTANLQRAKCLRQSILSNKFTQKQ